MLLVPRAVLHNVGEFRSPSSHGDSRGPSSMTGPAQPGTLAEIDIPATVSGFRHRKAWVWLPPAWTGQSPLPVIVLLAGAPGTPSDWLRSGRALEIADAWAATHHGVAPIMVVPDQNGTVTTDTECVDKPGRRAETYVAVDVTRFVISTFGASRDPANWAVVGMSEGATCALVLGLRHPDVYGGFADLSGAIAPSIGSPRATRLALFGGSLARQREYDPQWLLRRPRCGFAWFDAGTDDHTSLMAATTLSREARRAGLDVVFRTRPGGHSYWVVRPAFADAYPWLVSHLGAGAACRADIDA
jgi:S-formylglutathione hydrolase FrmB